jgi:phosphoheptose isomerase
MNQGSIDRLFDGALADHLRLVARMREELAPAVREGARRLVECVEGGHKILLCGNGGSAGDAQHIAAELVGRYRTDRRPLAAIALTTDTSVLTSIGNDYGFSMIFARQVMALGRPGDVLIAISTSGGSPNVIEAVKAARRVDMHTIGLLGRSSELLERDLGLVVSIPADDAPRIQEMHILVGHIWCAAIESAALAARGSKDTERREGT